MSTISPVSSNSPASRLTSQDAPAASRIPQQVLGQQDFLRLLATQFQAQDPLKPMEDTAFIAQMAQFSALEQSSAMASSLLVIRGHQINATANSYLGHRVTFDIGEGQTFAGTVGAVDVSGAEPRLVVGDRSFSLSAVLRVETGVPSAPPPAAPTGRS